MTFPRGAPKIFRDVAEAFGSSAAAVSPIDLFNFLADVLLPALAGPCSDFGPLPLVYTDDPDGPRFASIYWMGGRLELLAEHGSDGVVEIVETWVRFYDS